MHLTYIEKTTFSCQILFARDNSILVVVNGGMKASIAIHLIRESRPHAETFTPNIGAAVNKNSLLHSALGSVMNAATEVKGKIY